MQRWDVQVRLPDHKMGEFLLLDRSLTIDTIIEIMSLNEPKYESEDIEMIELNTQQQRKPKKKKFRLKLMDDIVASSGQDYETMPVYLYENRTQITQLDLSYNNIRRVEDIDQLSRLTILVLDNNQIGNCNSFPYLPTLKTLSLNNNNIDDLKQFIESIKEKFPNLTHLSLLKNPACPSLYLDGVDFGAYQFYRYFVLYHLRSLKFLDFLEVTPKERMESYRRQSHTLFGNHRRLNNEGPAETPQHDDGSISEQLESTRDSRGASIRPMDHHEGFHRQTSQSEGNKYIINDDL
ncbi:hypothetical protein SAMD00019534_043550 [Acytostelium subglobosum LB1]|uniref:hypothetical protein n=1 Tax=Acytostelium subglobosum LB1 TaxID=1410327 RepID=UPI000644DE16|nr:hypothetical protein SAMD00019534_043550 [Acytostelium subglobosum LB1]GAM21180.1 hypothetical protein SAMD00019534_043550 [Acytostelium subglobosum LB1]|eukprot:XP_012756314.1 hypothetical protein SAMD00019534_043550 [Acytostelium subglobosum LB1]